MPQMNQVNRLQGAQKGTTFCQNNQSVGQQLQDGPALGNSYEEQSQRAEEKDQEPEDTVTERSDNQVLDGDS